MIANLEFLVDDGWVILDWSKKGLLRAAILEYTAVGEKVGIGHHCYF